MKKIILPLLILLSFLIIGILPSSLNICMPDGCNFNNNVCDNIACVNETITQHLGERTQLLNAITIEFQSLIILVVILILFFVIQKYLEGGKLVAIKSYVKQKLLNSSSAELFNYLIEAFSNGILHPKIY